MYVWCLKRCSGPREAKAGGKENERERNTVCPLKHGIKLSFDINSSTQSIKKKCLPLNITIGMRVSHGCVVE